MWAWNSFLQCRERRIETSDTSTFIFEADPRARFEYEPGQFALVEVEIEGRKYQRAYSLSSPPSQDAISITVKRVGGGIVSNWLNDNLKAGDRVRICSPAGDLTIKREENLPSKVALFSADAGYLR